MSGKKIPVEELSSRFAYNPDTGIFTHRRGMRGIRAGTEGGSPTSEGYINLTLHGCKYRAHRVAWCFVHGDIPDGMFIDHINGIRTDNRISNLRLATNSQNAVNTSYRPNRKLPKGVCFTQTGPKPFRAFIMVNKKQIYLGLFDSEVEAAKAYSDAAKTYFGEFVP